MILLLTGAAFAQDGFTPASSLHQSRGGLELLDPGVGGQGSGWLATTISATEIIEAGPRRISAARLSTGYTIAPALRLDVTVPWLAAVVEDDVLTRPLGDLRVGGTVPIMRAEDGLGLSVGAGLSAPTSTLSSGLGGDVRLALGDEAGAARWRANVGLLASAGESPAVLLGIGADQQLSPWARLGGEVQGSGGIGETTAIANGYLHVGPEHAPLMGTLGGGIGLVGGPLFRVAMGLTWRWGQTGGDLDGDGLADILDDCPAAPEDADGYQDDDGCPDPDDDGDGIGDLMDLCPQEAEDADGFDDEDGCPELDNDLDGTPDITDDCPVEPGPISTGGCPDSDGDGLVDTEDECPTVWGRPEAFGCPDVDGDRVPDYRDDCPHDPAPEGADPLRSDGCPTDAFVSDGRIEILGVVHFATDEAVILPESFPLLLQVASVLSENSDIALVEIAGHTDETGSDKYNRELSDRRAGSVRRFLVESGRIDSSRLVVSGYGESRPIQSNETEEGRAANRRVEFVILEMDE